MSNRQDSLNPTNGKHTLSCSNCGKDHVVYSPSSEYISTTLGPCPRVDHQKGFFDCVSCNKTNTFYWHKRHRDDRFAKPPDHS